MLIRTSSLLNQHVGLALKRYSADDHHKSVQHTTHQWTRTIRIAHRDVLSVSVVVASVFLIRRFSALSPNSNINSQSHFFIFCASGLVSICCVCCHLVCRLNLRQRNFQCAVPEIDSIGVGAFVKSSRVRSFFLLVVFSWSSRIAGSRTVQYSHCDHVRRFAGAEAQ